MVPSRAMFLVSLVCRPGYGFGPALLNFVTYLASNPTIPNVISMTLGSLSWDSCNIMCQQVSQSGGGITYQQCVAYMHNRDRCVCIQMQLVWIV